MTFKKLYRLLLFVILSLVLTGCEDDPLKFSVRYDSLGDLKSKVPIYFEKTEVGHIEKIVSTDRGDYLVKVLIAPEHKDVATDNSQFFIQDDPFDSNRKVMIIEQIATGGTALQDGSIVHGEKRQGFLNRMITNLKQSKEEVSGKLQEAVQGLKESLAEHSQTINKQLEDALGDIDRSFKEFGDSLDSNLNDDELEKLQQALDDFVEEFKRASEDVQDQIREDILPQLRRDLDTLKDRLQEEGRRDDAEQIDARIIEI